MSAAAAFMGFLLQFDTVRLTQREFLLGELQ